MQVPLEVTYRDVPKTDAIEALVQGKVARLERVCDHISSCHIAIEKAHDRPSNGSPYRVRIDLTVPPGHELAAVENPGEGTQYEPLEVVIRDTFAAAERQLKELNERQHDQVKAHPTQSVTGIITQLFPEEGYGFLKTLEGQEIYFHRNSVLQNDYDRLAIGTGVHFFVEEGEEGPQASTVKIVDKPGAHVPESSEAEEIEPPLGWQQ
ncbi:HPF/RaiA family ribosome-associated protein [Romeria aff. gracilis LEGE 07310]|uniref:HPF/RaiA family ribosome-associated protein n=1 Tax=Vasconcelosia minhoensis LEGE 07310 TaxID=915328 RepID=A0A8J7ATL3_9CYAN|nr:HPF/RaiA family ribosome-associated protein [Romeria gracilis]MBE9080325.1 HPF/RaiA family ribosome-associated protein [Romeria aff. gracilis LEGE 07310]